MALRDEKQPVEAPATAVKRKSKGKLVAIVAVVVLAGGGAAGWMMLRGHGAPNAAEAGKDGAAAGKGKPAIAKAELYLALEPSFVVNFRADDSMRYLQVGVTLMSHEPEPLAVAKEAEPVVRDALLMLFSRQDFAILSDPAGKQKLQEQALATVRKVVGDRLGRPGIDALYFTSFVMQ